MGQLEINIPFVPVSAPVHPILQLFQKAIPFLILTYTISVFASLTFCWTLFLNPSPPLSRFALAGHRKPKLLLLLRARVSIWKVWVPCQLSSSQPAREDLKIRMKSEHGWNWAVWCKWGSFRPGTCLLFRERDWWRWLMRARGFMRRLSPSVIKALRRRGRRSSALGTKRGEKTIRLVLAFPCPLLQRQRRF